MTIAPFTFRVSRGHLDTFDGTEIGWLILDPDGAAAADPSMTTVEDLTGELDTGDAPDYERGTIAVVWDAQIGKLVRDPGEAVPVTDTTGGTPRAVVFFGPGGSDAARELISFNPVPEGAGFADWDIDPANGIAIADDTADFTLDELSDVDTSSTAPTNGQALVWDAALGRWVPGDVAGGGSASNKIVEADYIVATAAIDGTSDSFYFLKRAPAASASGIIPAGWEANGGEADAATLAAFLGDLPGDTATVFVPSEGAAYTVTATNFTDPWVDLEATIVDATSYPAFPCIFDLDGTGSYVPREARSIPNPDGQTGLLVDVPMVGQQIGTVEGILDRDRFMSCVGTTNKNLAALGSATFEQGWLRFAGGPETNMLLIGQTVTGENGHYKVFPDFTYEKIPNPSTFDPPGQGAPLWISNPGDPHHGAEWRWFDHDPTQNMRAVDSTDAVGAWVLQHDPTASSGSGPDLSDVDPEALGTADPGTSPDAARSDHVHDLPTAGDVGAVPTGRTLAGLDLTDDLTAAELRAAIGDGEWAKPVLHAFTSWKDASHAPSRLFSNGRWFAATLTADFTSLNRWIEWYAGHFDAGTWKQLSFGERGAALGTCTFELTPLAGGSAITVGTAARYNSTTEAAPDPVEHTGIVIPTSGQYVLRSTVTAGGNGVSTNAAQRWSGFQFVRTA